MSIVDAKYFFKCKGCGNIYQVTEKRFLEFVPEQHLATIQKEVVNGTNKGILLFKEGCPYCRPDNKKLDYQVIIKGLKKIPLN